MSEQSAPNEPAEKPSDELMLERMNLIAIRHRKLTGELSSEQAKELSEKLAPSEQAKELSDELSDELSEEHILALARMNAIRYREQAKELSEEYAPIERLWHYTGTLDTLASVVLYADNETRRKYPAPQVRTVLSLGGDPSRWPPEIAEIIAMRNAVPVRDWSFYCRTPSGEGFVGGITAWHLATDPNRVSVITHISSHLDDRYSQAIEHLLNAIVQIGRMTPADEQPQPEVNTTDTGHLPGGANLRPDYDEAFRHEQELIAQGKTPKEARRIARIEYCRKHSKDIGDKNFRDTYRSAMKLRATKAKRTK